MISSVLVGAMALFMQPADSTRASREAFTGCLRAYVDHASNAHTSQADFTAAYPQQCAAQQTAFRTAIVTRERASRSTAAQAEESANMEIEDARTNFSERFEMSLPATPATQTAAAPAATGTPATTPAATAAATPAPAPASTATPAATPASVTTPPH